MNWRVSIPVSARSELSLTDLADLGDAERNLALQNELIALRAATASAYSTAQHLQDRWKEIEQKQAGLYSVSLSHSFPSSVGKRIQIQRATKETR